MPRSRRRLPRRSPPGPRPDPGLAWTRWLWPAGLGALFLVALSWRLAYLGRLAATPFESSLTVDARIYWDWAGYLLHHGPIGKNPFFLGPLYPYSLAVLRLVLGDSVHRVLVVQAIGGALAVTLLADAARRLTTPAIGLGVGALLAFYRAAVFFDGLVLMESPMFDLEAVLLWMVVRAEPRRPGARTALGLGAMVGLLAEGRASSLLLLVPAVAFLIETGGGPGRERGRRLAALFAGFVLLVAPAAIRNQVVGGEWVPFTYNAGFNLHVGNGPGAAGGFTLSTTQSAPAVVEDGGIEADGRELIRASTGRWLSPNQSSAWWARQALDWIGSHPAAAAGLVARRLGMMWNRREYPQIENADVYDRVAGPLGIPLLGTFALLGALALAGIPFAWRRGPAGRFIAGYAAAITLGVLPFFVTDRYRHHLVPAAALLAAIVLDRIRRAIPARAWRSWRAPALALAAGLVVVNLPAPYLSGGKKAWGTYFDIGTRWLEAGRPDLAVVEYEQALDLERRGRVRRLPGVQAAVERAGLYNNYGRALRLLGRDREALPWLERAAREAPEGAPELAALADALRHAGRTAEADQVEARLSRVAGGASQVLLARGWRAAAADRLADAESLFAAAATAEPSLYDAWAAEVRIQVQRGNAAAARATLARAREAGMPDAAYHAHHALVLAALGDTDGAERELGALPDSAEQNDPVLADVIRNTRGLLAPRR